MFGAKFGWHMCKTFASTRYSRVILYSVNSRNLLWGIFSKRRMYFCSRKITRPRTIFESNRDFVLPIYLKVLCVSDWEVNRKYLKFLILFTGKELWMLFAIIACVGVCLFSGHVKGLVITGMPTILQLLCFRISELASFTILVVLQWKKEKWQHTRLNPSITFIVV